MHEIQGFFHLGNRCYLSTYDFSAAVSYKGTTLRRLKNFLLDKGKLVVVTRGKAIRTLVFTRSGIVYATNLSSSYTMRRYYASLKGIKKNNIFNEKSFVEKEDVEQESKNVSLQQDDQQNFQKMEELEELENEMIQEEHDVK